MFLLQKRACWMLVCGSYDNDITKDSYAKKQQACDMAEQLSFKLEHFLCHISAGLNQLHDIVILMSLHTFHSCCFNC